MKTINIRLPDVEAAMLLEVQKVNRAYRDLQGLLLSQIQQEYAKTPAARAKRLAKFQPVPAPCPQMRRLPALVAALLLPAAQPVLLGTALSNASRFDGYGASDYLWQQFLRAGDRWRMSDWQCQNPRVMLEASMEDSLRLELVEEHGDLIIACYEKLFPGELNRFDDRYCGRVYDVREWAQDCLENAYDGFDEEDIPSLDAWLEFEFFDHYSHDKDLCVGFSNRQRLIYEHLVLFLAATLVRLICLIKPSACATSPCRCAPKPPSFCSAP